MFQKIRNRLIVAYIGVLTVILTLFTVAVRLNFSRSLDRELNLRLENLATAAAFNMDIEEDKYDIDREEILVRKNQTIEWFDLQEEEIAKQGEDNIELPLNTARLNQIEAYYRSIRSFSKQVSDLEDGEFIGYVRVSESLEELNNTLRRLDYGLASGIGLSLLLSGIGGIWLTHRAMQPIEQSFDRLKQFTADASHELRNPLMAIKTNADVALKYPDGMRASDAEKFASIASASNQMKKLTEDLLLLARSDRIKILIKELVNLSLILSDLKQLYESQAKEQAIIWQAEIAEDLYLSGDKILLERLFANLLQNALHYTPRNGTIKIAASRQNSRIVVKIEDTGIGIAPEHLDRIFDRFWQVDTSRSFETGRCGLGLAIVREILQQHDGKIIVESQLGLGSCFAIFLPI